MVAAVIAVAVVFATGPAAAPGTRSAEAPTVHAAVIPATLDAVAHPAAPSPAAADSRDGPILLGKVEVTIDMSPAAVKARAETHDVVCPGTEPCGP
jgi:hypothetical protein